MMEIIDNSPEVLKALENATKRGLTACGEVAVGYAQKALGEQDAVDTGRLRGSITYQVDGQDCYVGTNVEYASYIEYGTGIESELGGRRTPWAYEDKNGWHTTEGMRARPYLRPATSNHTKEYTDILKDSLENA